MPNSLKLFKAKRLQASARSIQENNIGTALLVVTMLAPDLGLAQPSSNVWAGMYGQVGLVGYGSVIPAAASGTVTTPSASVVSSSFTASHANGPVANIGAGYNFAINENYLLGIGAAFYPGRSKSASTTSTNALGTITGSYNVAKVFGVFLSPSYAIDQERFIYTKIGYTASTLQFSASGNAGGNFSWQSIQMNGMAFGLGYKQILSGSIYGFAEATYGLNKPKQVSVATDDHLVLNSTIKASVYDALFGIGYRF